MNPSKKKGTAAETKVVKYLNAHGVKAERKALAGSNDEGDLRAILPCGTEVTIEVKAGMQTAQYNRHDFEIWATQTLVEGHNAGCPAVLVIVRYRRQLKDAEVWIPTSEFRGWTRVYLDSWVEDPICHARH